MIKRTLQNGGGFTGELKLTGSDKGQPIPLTPEQRVEQLEIDKVALEGDNITALLALAELYEQNLSLQATNDELQLRLTAAESDTITALMGIADVYETILPLIGG